MTSKLKIVGIEKIKRKIPSGITAKELSNLIKENKFPREDVIDYLMKRRAAHILKKSKRKKKGFSWGPILIDSEYESFLSILNFSYRCENNEFKLKLYSQKGKVLTKNFKTSKSSPLILNTNDLRKFNNSLQGMCWYSVESIKNNIHGFSFHMNKKSRNISGEHSF